MTSRRRFLDPRKTLGDLEHELLVECAACGGCARVAPAGGSSDRFAPRRFVCGCGAVREPRPGARLVPRGAICDPTFGLPLWLQVGCTGETLWAYNREHLALIKAFVAARLRERAIDPVTGWRNKSAIARLPRWIQAGRHRHAVLRAIGKLEEKLAAARGVPRRRR